MLTCFGLSRCLTNCKHPDTKSVTYDVKEPYADYSEGDLENTMKKAQSFVDIIVAADCDRKDAHFRKALRGSISAASWTENLAKAILTKLESIIQNKNKIGQTLRDTIQKAVVAAFEFAKNHPVYTTIIVLGVLVEIAPWVLTALGFAEGGIVEGKEL